MNNILEVKNVNKSYDNFALKDISFSLPKGMIMGLIGENGAGKTTTIKIILNLIKKYQGNVQIFGLDNSQNEKEIKEDVGVVLDDSFFPDILTAKDINIIMKGIYQNWDSNLYNTYLTKFNLPNNKQIKNFSKGMRKKLEIATSLAHHPKLLILDEPTSGLDPVARSEIIDIFQEFIQNSECSILFSTHITSDLEHIADYITFINNGHIVLSETKDEILEQYALVKCRKDEFEKINKNDYLKYKKNVYDYEVLIANKNEFKKKYDIKVIDKITLDDLMVLMIKGEE